MLPELNATASAFALGGRYLDRLVGDFTATDWAVRDAAGHDPRWLLGHVTTMRKRVMAMLGLEPVAAPWEASFGRGKSSADVPGDLEVGEVLAAFHAAGDAIAGAWEGQTAEALAKPLGRTMPNGGDTVLGALEFLAWHEAYHLGQLGLFRRLAGKPGAA